MANLYLNDLDHAVNEKCEQKPTMVRYADDLLILCKPGQGPGLQTRLKRWLEARKLKLNEEKWRAFGAKTNERHWGYISRELGKILQGVAFF